jgi:hypothetical protein
VEAAVGAGVASWPEGTVRRLEGVVAENPASGVARLHLGLALFADGSAGAAADEWRQVERSDPDSPAALRAEDLLHPDVAPGRPPFVWPVGRQAGLAGLSPARQLAELERRAEAGGAEDWLRYGIGLQRAGRPVSAERAFARAAERSPRDLDAQVAAAVGRFDKDDPSRMFSRLGPLSQRNPRAGVIRYHLGLGLTWIGAVDEAAPASPRRRRRARRLLRPRGGTPALPPRGRPLLSRHGDGTVAVPSGERARGKKTPVLPSRSRRTMTHEKWAYRPIANIRWTCKSRGAQEGEMKQLVR